METKVTFWCLSHSLAVNRSVWARPICKNWLHWYKYHLYQYSKEMLIDLYNKAKMEKLVALV